MSISDKWSTTTPGSVSKLNKMTIVTGTGAYLASLTLTEHTILVCTADGSGFTADHVYLCSADGTEAIDISEMEAHRHSSSTTGGTLLEILRSNPNPQTIDSGGQFIFNPDVANWITSSSGTGSVANDTDGVTNERSIEMETGGTSGSTAGIRQTSLEWDSSFKSWYKMMHKLDTASSLAVKAGVCTEPLSSADDNNRKYGHELCTTVNNNWFVLSANGSSRTSSDTGTAFDTTRTSFKAEHYPDLGTPKVDLYINEGTVFTKTSTIPTDYADDTGVNNVLRISLKNNTASNRNLRLFGARIAYQTSLKWDEQ